jgi:hypothetical protein
MHRFAVLAVLAVAACAHNPRAWVPSRYSAPPGIAREVWEGCWQAEEAAAVAESGWGGLTPEQRRCALLRLTAACVRDVWDVVKLRHPSLAVRSSRPDFDEAVDGAEDAQCGEPGGGGAAVDDFVERILSRGRGSTEARGQCDVCPAN